MMAGAYEAGMSLIHDRRSSEAVAVFRQAVDQHPRDADAWAGLALALAQLNNAQEALEASDQALRLDPTQATALNVKVLAFVQLGQYTEGLTIADDTGCPISPDEKASANLMHSAMRRPIRQRDPNPVVTHLYPNQLPPVDHWSAD
jgi:tetratricopeptide (TPR) repeat protein